MIPRLGLVALLVLASGCSALVFQIAWMRELRLVFGATTASVAAVLAVFMAGLGIGSIVLGKRADLAVNPLRLYGFLEIGIALSAAMSPWLIALASRLYFGLGGQESLGMAGATVVRLALATVVMIVPAFLMGGTLPAAARAVTRPSDAHRRALAVLYGANTLGAVFGAAGATFFSLENLGTRATLSIGCALSFVVGAIAVVRSRSLPDLTNETEANASCSQIDEQDCGRSVDRDERNRKSHPRLVYLTAAVLGFTFFGLELVWYRMLAPILGGTAFTFGLILCIALLGIGIGGLAYPIVFRRLRPNWSALAITCGLEAIFAILPFALGDRLAWLAAGYAESATSFSDLVIGWSYVAGIVVLPVALISGLQFPLLIAQLGQGRDAVSNHVGMTYAWNTLGAIAGSLAGGFGGLPLLSATGMWQAIALTIAILSLVILILAARTSRRIALIVVGLFLTTIGGLFAEGPSAVWRHSGVGAGRAISASADPNTIRRWVNEQKEAVRWEAEGVESGIGILGTNGLSFAVNGKSDGNSLSDAPTQIGMAILAAVLHEEPKTALVIGLGTGETAGWLAEMRGIERVDVVELEPTIDEMAHRCRDLNWDVLNHPRVRRIYNDGREYILTTNTKYDLIISEPSNPYRAGVATLYTTEFYQAALGRLNPGGLFIQWLQAYEVDQMTIDTVLATARSTFGHVELWQTMAPDLQLICSASPITYSEEELRARIGTDTVKLALAKVWNVHDLEGFLGHFVASPGWIDEVAKLPYVDRNTDDRTILEYRFAKSVGRVTPFSIEQMREHLQGSNQHRPTLEESSIDWREVELRRQEFNMMLDGQVSGLLLPDAKDKALIEAFMKLRAEDYAGAINLWPSEPANDIQRLLLARCYAELGSPDCLELISVAEKQFPLEAAALRSVYHVRAGDAHAAMEPLKGFLAQLANDPWMIPIVTESGLPCALDVAREDEDAARELFNVLARPFAGNRLDYNRKLARLHASRSVGTSAVVEALAEFEPHPPWIADVLKLRAQIYTDQKHPKANDAERDWQQFQRNQN